MKIVSMLLPHLLFAYTVLIEPFLRINFYRAFKKQLNIDASARILFYRTQVIWEWSWVVVLALIVAPSSQPWVLLGITVPNQVGWLIIAALVIGIGLSIVLLRRNPGAMERMQASLKSSAILLPSTPAERKWYSAVAITAGICEELLYRGFLMHYLDVYFPFLGWLLAAIISGILFGISRAYLGFKGIAEAALFGFSYAVAFILSGSLLPAMVLHILFELRTLWLWQPQEEKKNKK